VCVTAGSSPEHALEAVTGILQQTDRGASILVHRCHSVACCHMQGEQAAGLVASCQQQRVRLVPALLRCVWWTTPPIRASPSITLYLFCSRLQLDGRRSLGAANAVQLRHSCCRLVGLAVCTMDCTYWHQLKWRQLIQHLTALAGW